MNKNIKSHCGSEDCVTPMEITRHAIQIETSPTAISYSRLKSSGLNAHFFPATGYTFGCYRQLLTRISKDFNLVGMDIRPMWPDIGPPPEDHNWNIYLNDLIAFIDSLGEGPVVGIGHSLGAITTVRAASIRPDLFSAIILLEPALYPASWIWVANMIPWHIKSKRQPIAKALNRKDTWESKKDVFDSFRRRRVFSKFSDDTIEDFLEYGLTPVGDGFRLMFRKDWEARIYGDPPFFWKDLKKLSKPVLGVKGRDSNVFLEGQWKKWKKIRNQDTHVRVENATHLLPLESPEATANAILNWAANTDIKSLN